MQLTYMWACQVSLLYSQTMVRMRRTEIAADLLYKQKLARGFLHLADGQEAVPVGIEAALDFKDSMIQSYRDHCTFLGRGGSVKELFAELLVYCTSWLHTAYSFMHFSKLKCMNEFCTEPCMALLQSHTRAAEQTQTNNAVAEQSCLSSGADTSFHQTCKQTVACSCLCPHGVSLHTTPFILLFLEFHESVVLPPSPPPFLK